MRDICLNRLSAVWLAERLVALGLDATVVSSKLPSKFVEYSEQHKVVFGRDAVTTADLGDFSTTKYK
jgi:hypothetical protein